MICSKCQSATHCKDSRAASFMGLQATRQRYACRSCGHKQVGIVILFNDNAALPKLIMRRMARFIDTEQAAVLAGTFKVIK